jgi:polyisoprenoid-binding protein YceI
MEIPMIRALCIMATLIAPLPLIAQDLPPPVAGEFTIDPVHTRVLFRVNHLGFSNYTAFFRDFDAKLTFDPEQPEKMQVTATIKAASIETMDTDPSFDFNAIIAGEELLDAAKYPEITFKSTDIALTGDNTADVTGDFTLHGVTKPLTLAVTFNGGYGPTSFDPSGARIGFSATGKLLRSDFGMTMGIPEPGTTMGVGDAVDVIIETEFINPDAAKP